MKVFLFLVLAVACVLAAEEQRVKKDVVVNGVLVRGIDEHGNDDGSYYPGKYEVPTFGYAGHPYAYSAAYPYAYNHWGHNLWGARAGYWY